MVNSVNKVPLWGGGEAGNKQVSKQARKFQTLMSVAKKLREGAVTGQRGHRERITSIGVQGGPRQGVGFALRTEG